MFLGKLPLYLFLILVIPSLTSETNWFDFAKTIRTEGRSSILLLFICLLHINIRPVLEIKNSHSVTSALTFSLSIFLIDFISRFFATLVSSEQTFSGFHWFSSKIFSKTSFVEFISSINMNLPPELVKFLAKIKSLEPMLGKDDSPLSDSSFFYF